MPDRTRDPSVKRSGKKHRSPAPPVDALTVGWMTTLVTATACELGAAAARSYVRWSDPGAKLMQMFSAYLLLASALIGIVLLLLTAVVVHAGRSKPPLAVIVTALVVGLAPWIAMVLQGTG